jgi:AcrR family transcriptional regulator
MLVNRYFGSKERLFAEVVANTMARPIILTAQTLSAPDRGADVATLLVSLTAADATPLDGFRILLKSAASARAAEIGREQIEAHHHRTLTAALRGPHAPQRAAVVLSLVAGIQMMRQMIGLSALADTPPEVLAKILAPLFQQLMAAPAQQPRPRSARRASDPPTPEAGS